MAKPDERFKIYGEVFDDSTIRVLYELKSRHYFDDFEGVVATGKEANVFRVKKGNRYIAAKIYMTETSEFRNMRKYISGDPRFTNIGRGRRDIVFAWARKEYRNLLICREAGVRAPKPIVQRNNVLLMEFIGRRGVVAPLAIDMQPKDPKKWYSIILGYIKKLYKSDIVHGDISKYNVMNLDEEPVLIDISQGVKIEHPLSWDMLKRDIKNVNTWFKNLGIKTRPEKEILRWLR